MNRSALRGLFRPGILLPALLVAAVFAAGCGGGGGSDNSSTQSEVDARLDEQAATKAKQAADKVVQATPDKHLPGPKSY